MNKKRRRELIDSDYTFLGFLQAEIAELGLKDGDLEIDESVSMYEFKSSDATHFKNLILQNVSDRCKKTTP